MEKQRQISITREKKFWSAARKFQCYVNGQVVAEIGNGKTITFPINTEEHELTIAFITGNPYIGNQQVQGCFISNKVVITADDLDKHFDLKVNVSPWTGKGEFVLKEK